jgi:hypothetical protein
MVWKVWSGAKMHDFFWNRGIVCSLVRTAGQTLSDYFADQGIGGTNHASQKAQRCPAICQAALSYQSKYVTKISLDQNKRHLASNYHIIKLSNSTYLNKSKPADTKSIRRWVEVPVPNRTPMEMPSPQKTSGLWATPNFTNHWSPERLMPSWAAIFEKPS